jgi:hypothetical protein
MRYARCHLIDPHTPGVYHCASRRVRRAFVCGVQELTGRSFEHHRSLIERRIHLRASSFALSVFAYAVMSNLLHWVIYTDPVAASRWHDDGEVIEHWRTALPGRKDAAKSGTASSQPAAIAKVSAEWISPDPRLNCTNAGIVRIHEYCWASADGCRRGAIGDR